MNAASEWIAKFFDHIAVSRIETIGIKGIHVIIVLLAALWITRLLQRGVDRRLRNENTNDDGAIHTDRRDKGQPHEEWQGSFGVEGLNTRFKIGGFAELDVIHDSDAIGTPGEFVTSAIVTRDATKVEGADGQTNFSVNPSRLYVETRTPINQHRLTTFLSFDLFGDSTSTTPEPRLRQAYGEVTNILFGGDLLAGQAWSTFADLEASPNTLDFEGPNSFFGTRQPLVRWTRGITDGLKLMVAAETPDNHIIQGADALTAWPDGVVSLVWDQAPVHLMGAFLARDLRASLDNEPTETAFAWGGSFSGKVGMPFIAEKDFMTFSATYGEGIGSGFNDSPPDAVFDSAGTSLKAIPVFGYLYLKSDTELDLAPLPSIKKRDTVSDSIWDGIVGIKGHVNLNKNWYLPYYADIGTGSSNITWQLFGGIGYRFKRLDLIAAYRYMDWNFNDDGAFDDLNLSGPFVGVKFKL